MSLILNELKKMHQEEEFVTVWLAHGKGQKGIITDVDKTALVLEFEGVQQIVNLNAVANVTRSHRWEE